MGGQGIPGVKGNFMSEIIFLARNILSG